MPLNPGTSLGPYEIATLLGQGGMGEVYRAHDPRLGRFVAIKVLHSAVTSDADRRSRFEQEARAAGALNHPNIVSIYDIGTEGGALYVVQELLEGETLRDRLRAGDLPVRKILDYAVQAARGLAAAHSKGIVHRDLKPENLFLTKDGRLKILDFGLAKLVAPKGSSADATSLPTQTLGTEPGMVLGTIGYMSPEQVRGQEVDPRCDLFALGAILLEMITGQRAFHGATAADTMSAILKDDPAGLSTLKPTLPAGLDRIVRHALEKNPDERFHSAQDLAFDLESLTGASSAAHPAATPVATRRRPPIAGALVLGALLGGVFLGRVFFSRSGPDLAAYHFTALASEQGIKLSPVWSPDQKAIAYAAQIDGVFQILTRSLDQPVPAQLTHSATDCESPFWTPDSTHLFYLSSGSLWQVTAAGGAPTLQARNVLAAHISPDGKELVLARRDPGGTAVSLQPVGGTESRLALVPAGDPTVHFAPDGASIGMLTTSGEGAIAFWRVSLAGGHIERVIVTSTMLRGSGTGGFSWFPDSRHIVFSGALAKTGHDHLLTADLRSGKIMALTPAANYETDPSLSPDGSRLAFALANADTDIVSVPLDGRSVSTVLATSANEHCAAWSPNGDQFVYSKEHDGVDEVWVHSVRDGFERPLATAASFRDGSAGRVSEARFSPDGQRVVFARISGGQYSLWVVNVAGGAPVPLGVNGQVPVWSPDGNWIAYEIPSGGLMGLSKVPAGGGKSVELVPVSSSFLTRSQWSPDGRWLTWISSKGLSIAPADGGQTQVLSDATGWLPVAGFSKDGADVIAIRADERRHFVVEAIEIRSKHSRVILDMGPQRGMHGFSLAPDGKSFLTSLESDQGDIWLLDGFAKP